MRPYSLGKDLESKDLETAALGNNLELVAPAPSSSTSPDMVAGSVLLGIGPVHDSPGQTLARGDRLQQRAVGVPAAANVVNGAGSRRLDEVPERVDKIVGMDVVAHLLTVVAKHCVSLTGHRAFSEICQKTVEHRTGVSANSRALKAAIPVGISGWNAKERGLRKFYTTTIGTVISLADHSTQPITLSGVVIDETA